MDGWGEGYKNTGMGKYMDEQMNSQTITTKRLQPAPQIQRVGWTLSPRAIGQEESPLRASIRGHDS